mmetsp:Transcript_89131/g.277052  ORF Transcript_89131/g.277052 Transcript_89131/m.277052 type:complete len:212 (-) Transcript_89131:263-898(-)
MIEPAARDHEGHLLLYKAVLALGKDVRYLLGVIQLHGYSQGHWVIIVLEVQGAAHLQVQQLVGLRRGEVREALQVEADPREGRLVAERDDALDAVHLAQEVNGVALCVVLHVERDNLLDQVQQILHVFVFLRPLAILLRDLAGEVPGVLMAPAGEPLFGALEPVLQDLPGPLLLHCRREDGEEVRKKGLEAALRHLCVVLGQDRVVGPQEL